MPTKLILSTGQSPGDVVMLTAAVRDLHYHHPGRYLTDVRTPCPEMWRYNPHVTEIADDDRDAQRIDMEYPLIHWSNQLPYHAIHGYQRWLSQHLGVRVEPSRHGGDIHLCQEEIESHDPDGFGRLPNRYWLLVSGGKWDFTAKWPDPRLLQTVVNTTHGLISWVQVGEAGHWHPPIDGTLNLVGQTSLRQLVQLVYHAVGVLCPVTLLMHLTAAVPTRPDRPAARGCVVLAGGREPPSWEAYPTHHYLHTIGWLPCCASSGCWRSRCQTLGDGDPKDMQALCERPIEVTDSLLIAECQTLLPAGSVIDAVVRYHRMSEGRVQGPLVIS